MCTWLFHLIYFSLTSQLVGVLPHSSMEDLPDLEKAPLLAEAASHITHYDTNTQEVPSLTEDVHNQQVLCDSIYSDRNARNTRLLPNNVPQPFVYLGYCCAILAGLCFTSSNVMVKYIPDVNSWQLLFVRCVSQLLAMFPIMWHGKHSMFGTPDLATRWRIGAQGVLGGILLLCIFVAVARMPLGDCTAIFFSSPAFTRVLSCIILKDQCTAASGDTWWPPVS